jgi:hypothetical protein
MKWLSYIKIMVFICAIFALGIGSAPFTASAFADDDNSVIEDTYVAPLDLNGSDEDVHEQASSGFDTSGPVVVQPDYYNSTQPDSTDSSGNDSSSDDSGE